MMAVMDLLKRHMSYVLGTEQSTVTTVVSPPEPQSTRRLEGPLFMALLVVCSSG